MSQLHSSITGGYVGEAKTLTKLNWSLYCPGHYAVFVLNVLPANQLTPIRKDPYSEAGYKYILLAMDYFTKWAETYLVPNMEAITVARTLTNMFFFGFLHPNYYT